MTEIIDGTEISSFGYGNCRKSINVLKDINGGSVDILQTSVLSHGSHIGPK